MGEYIQITSDLTVHRPDCFRDKLDKVFIHRCIRCHKGVACQTFFINDFYCGECIYIVDDFQELEDKSWSDGIDEFFRRELEP